MRIIEGIEKVRHYFPRVELWRYLDLPRNDTLARQMHMIGECMVNDRKDLIKLMDNLGLEIYQGEFIKLQR